MEEYLKNKEIKKTMKETLYNDEKKHIQKDSNGIHIRFCSKLKCDDSRNEKSKRKIILEYSLEYINFVNTEGIESLIERTIVFTKFRIVEIKCLL